MTHADPHALAYSRLMRLADQVLNALETAPRPTTAMDIARTARAIMAAERMLRAIYTPLVKAKPKAVKEVVSPEAPLASPVLTASEAKMTEGAKPVADISWKKGYADKQAQMREQRAARTGKWPDGTPYKKSG